MTRTLQAGNGYILINDNQEALYYPTKTSAPVPVTRKNGLFGEINYESELFLVQFSKEEVYLRTIYLGQGNTPQTSSIHIEKNDLSQMDLTYDSNASGGFSSLIQSEETKDGVRTCITYQNGVQSLKNISYQDGKKQDISFAKNGVTKLSETTLTTDGINKTTLYNPLTTMPVSKQTELSAQLSQSQQTADRDLTALMKQQLDTHGR